MSRVTSWDAIGSVADAIQLFQLKKTGNICTLSFYFNTPSTTTSQWLKILRITETDFYPSQTLRFSFNDMNGNNFVGLLETNGTVLFMQQVNGVFQGSINISWIVE